MKNSGNKSNTNSNDNAPHIAPTNKDDTNHHVNEMKKNIEDKARN